MRIIFHPDFYRSDYSNDGSAASGRMEAIMDQLKKSRNHIIVKPEMALEEDIRRAHKDSYVHSVKKKQELFEMAMLSAGAAITASQLCLTGTPAMSINRPPGHHAYREMGWGYCHFNNMAIALLRLLEKSSISSAFLIDFDAHTGDGTRDILKGMKNIRIFNPMAETPQEYIKQIEDHIKDLPKMDIIAVCAGFDNYEKDLGKKLRTFDFYNIGIILKNLSKKFGNNKRFAVLEGGYYQPDLGKNVAAFCEGFE